ncbi:MAG: TetR family transcriptional regulator [Rhodobacteraceae bacterium]|nr:MAG: TetR family transcriptional regulator [Paracoccaceae bacterium]
MWHRSITKQSFAFLQDVMANSSPTRIQINNRRELVLETAAGFFVRKGFNGTSIRDIAKAAGMLPGSLYYHFPSKEALLVAVFEEGVQRISDAVDNALSACPDDAWARLQIACEAHLATLLQGSDFAHVVVRVVPHDAPGAEQELVILRNAYEARFITLVEALALPPGTDHSLFRLMLIGAMNHAPLWYREGQETPASLARQFITNLRFAQDIGNSDIKEQT